MLEKFNGIFYLIIYLVHFIGVGVYAFQTIFGTKNFMEKFGRNAKIPSKGPAGPGWGGYIMTIRMNDMRVRP